MADRKALAAIVDELEARIKAAPDDPTLPPLLKLALSELEAFDAGQTGIPANPAHSDGAGASVQGAGSATVAAPAEPAESAPAAPAPAAAPAPVAVAPEAAPAVAPVATPAPAPAASSSITADTVAPTLPPTQKPQRQLGTKRGEIRPGNVRA